MLKIKSYTKIKLLSPTELLNIYAVPVLNDVERREYFTLTKDEIKVLKSFKDTGDAIYFAACLVFFKMKLTLVNFRYQDITEERRHVMERYFSNKTPPRSLPKDRSTISRIENKVLKLCNYRRFTENSFNTIKLELQQLTPGNPRQRQLCKSFLDLLIKHRIAIPGYSTVQNMVSGVWNDGNNQITNAYVRYTTKNQRETILSLLNKTDNKYHHIISIRKDIKDFSTKELWQEIDKYNMLKPIFEIAKTILPKLKLPFATIDYYASLINYYNGPKLKEINKHTAQLYLLCYCYTRYQILNDNLLEALKKRTSEYEAKAVEYAKDKSLKQLELIRDTRKKVSHMLVDIKNHPDKKQVPKEKLYKHIPEDDLITTAKLLINDNFDQDWLYWKYIDSENDSIKLNLRKIFLAIDLIVTNNKSLQAMISYIKDAIIDGSFYNAPLPYHARSWVRKNYKENIIVNDEIIRNRLEFLLYKQITYQISTNKLTLEYSVKYKRVEDDLMPKTKWKKDKKRIINKLNYPKLKQPLKKTLKTKCTESKDLYKKINEDILSGKNKDIIITTKENGEQKWRLRPLEAASDTNDSLLANFQQRSIADVIQFVDNKTKFTRAFESILPKSKKGELDVILTMAGVLANAIRIGIRKMADISDLNKSSLLTAEAAYIRIETLMSAVDIINNAAAKLPIYKEWYIDSVLHGSLDGLKLETRLRNILARHSSKFFGMGIGVSAYCEVVNRFPIASYLIGAHDYEGNHSFEMVHHQNTSEIKPKKVSTDKHGTNAVNFGLFDFTDMVFAPRIPKPHREILWGFGSAKDYDGMIIKPTKFADERLLLDEEDNIKHLVSSFLTGDSKPSTVIRKLASKNYNSKTKKAFVQYNNIVKSQFLLSYLNNPDFRRAILVALNRGEEYNGLYRAITLIKKGELRGQNEIEMEIWHQCTRLISAIMLYYSTYILNSLYVATNDPKEKEFLLRASPCARAHINLLGYYQFRDLIDDGFLEQWIKLWDWKKTADT